MSGPLPIGLTRPGGRLSPVVPSHAQAVTDATSIGNVLILRPRAASPRPETDVPAASIIQRPTAGGSGDAGRSCASSRQIRIMGRVYPRLIALLLLAGALAAAATGASSPSQPAVVSATAHGISILVPGQPASVAAESTAPGSAETGIADGFVFPADGSLVRTGALSSSASSRATGAVGSQAVSDVLGSRSSTAR